MTDAEISRRLALAIGWSESSFYKWYADGRLVIEGADGWGNFFDYRDPAVIWPIAERFDAFPVFTDTAGWLARVYDSDTDWMSGDTAAKAVALAVIKAHEEKP